MNLTNEVKSNITSYMTEVFLPDALEGHLRDQESQSAPLSNLLGLTTSLIGSVLTFVNPATALARIAVAALVADAVRQYVGNQVSPTARWQANNAYWYMVKRRIFCSLPNSTDSGVLTEAVRNRIADRIENIVPFNNRSPMTVSSTLGILEAQGKITRTSGKARSICIVRETQA